jgi:hypothetical protein
MISWKVYTFFRNVPLGTIQGKYGAIPYLESFGGCIMARD